MPLKEHDLRRGFDLNRRLAARSVAPNDHDLGDRMVSVLRRGIFNMHVDGWVQQRMLARFFQVPEEVVVDAVGMINSIRAEDGAPYFETKLDEKRQVWLKAVLQGADAAADTTSPPQAGSPEPAPKEDACDSELAEAPCDGARPSTHAEEVEELRAQLATERARREEVQHAWEQDLRSKMQAEHSRARQDSAKHMKSAMDVVLTELLQQREKLEQLEGQHRPEPTASGPGKPASA